MKYYRALDGMLWKHDPSSGWWYSYDRQLGWMEVTNNDLVVVARGTKEIAEADLMLEMI